MVADGVHCKFGPVKVIRLETPVPPHFQPGFQGAEFRTHMSTFPTSPCVPFLVPRVSGAFPSLLSAFPLIVLQEWKREKRGPTQLKRTNRTLDLLVQDQTGESKFTLLDSEAKLIVKTTAAKIVKLSLAKIEDQDVLPPEIVEIVGKTYGFGFSDDDNNMIGGADVSTAMKVWNLNDIMWKRIKSLHQMSTYSRKKQCTNDEGDKNKSG
ncbi:hypothetical protein YC2023_121660 [Brassica napus]